MAANTLNEITNHLQFLGYEITQKDTLTIAKHAKKWNMMIRVNKGGFLFTTINGTKDSVRTDRSGYLEFINLMNSKASVVHFYTDADCDFFMEAWYPDYYDKVKFGEFLDTWETETMGFLTAQSDKALKYLK